MADTAIEWTDKVWNPTTGCDRVSPGCDHCYALTMAKRLKGMGSAKYQNDGDPRTSGPGFLATEHSDALMEPLRWRKPSKVFVNSMSDLFHERVSDEFLARVFAVMAATPRHTFQVLTKRHARMRSLLSSGDFRRLAKDAYSEMQLSGLLKGQGGSIVINAFPSKNVWLGVSVESQQWADIRIPALLDTPAAVRWLSCEPLLGPVDLGNVDCGGCAVEAPCPVDGGALSRIDWVVAGGESGPGARPMHPDWARSLRDQCTAAGVPFLFKQWGEWLPYEDDAQPPYLRGQNGDLVDGHCLPGTLTDQQPVDGWWWPGFDEALPASDAVYRRVGKKAAGRELDGRTHDEFPESWARLSGEGASSAGAPNQGGDR